METTSFKDPKTRALRLAPILQPNDLPPHPLLAPLQSGSGTPLTLAAFAKEVLREAVAFSDSVIPTTFQKSGSPKSSAPSLAKVQVLSSDLIKGETWFARQSHHENRTAEGTASYEDFEYGLYHDHSLHEAQYTPNVVDAYKVLDWSQELKAIGEQGMTDEFQGVAMEIFEMVHHIPEPLQNRVFPVLVVRAKTGSNAFVVAQIPVDISKLPRAMYSNGRHKTEGDSKEKRQNVTVGAYTSVERVRVLDDDHILWQMGTASDAKGLLPMPLQKMGVPGAIVKDVGFFIKWVNQRRGTSEFV